MRSNPPKSGVFLSSLMRMAQLRFNDAKVNPLRPQADLTHYWTEGFTDPKWPRPLGEYVRRRDVKGDYGTGTPKMSEVAYSPFGVAESHVDGYTVVQTDNGPICMPVNVSNEQWDKHFLPTCATLRALPFTDSRGPLLSDRYYK